MEVQENKRSYFAGRPRVKIYQYNPDGSFVQAYDSQMEVFNKYFDGKKGDLFHNGDIRALPDNTYVTRNRIGRLAVRKAVRILNSDFCKDYKTHRPISAFNLKGEKIASFRSVRHAALMCNISYSTIASQLFSSKNRNKSHAEISFVYDS